MVRDWCNLPIHMVLKLASLSPFPDIMLSWMSTFTISDAFTLIIIYSVRTSQFNTASQTISHDAWIVTHIITDSSMVHGTNNRMVDVVTQHSGELLCG